VTRKPLPPSFVCPLCSLRSFHPKDIEQRLCARCGFVDDVIERGALPIARHDIPAEAYPFTIVAFRSDNGAEVWRREVIGPGAVYMPPLAKQAGCRVVIEVRWPDGRVDRQE
jgi:hypothetical protein